MVNSVQKKDVKDWWERFATVVEDPDQSTYGFLKKSLYSAVSTDGHGLNGQNISFFKQLQAKAISQSLKLTDPAQLHKLIEKMHSNRILFPYKTRVALQCVAVLLDSYVKARSQYKQEIEELALIGAPEPSAAEKQVDLERIIQDKLTSTEVDDAVEEIVSDLSDVEKQQVHRTIEDAKEQLQQNGDIQKISRDVFGVSKKYLTIENAATLCVSALPLMTWQYRWVLAAGLGAYVSRMTVYHGYHAAKTLFQGDLPQAKEHGKQSLEALKAAGGNIITIGLAPAIAKLPAKIAVWGAFAANNIYKAALGLGQKLLTKREPRMEEDIAPWYKRAWRTTRDFVKKNADSLILLSVKTARVEKPKQVSEKVEKASGRMQVSKVWALSAGLYKVGRAAGRRSVFELKDVFSSASEHCGAYKNRVVEKISDYKKQSLGSFWRAANDNDTQKNENDVAEKNIAQELGEKAHKQEVLKL